MVFKRQIVGILQQRITESPIFIQIVIGPRQVGKTTAVTQVMEDYPGPSVYSAADSTGLADASWITTKWQEARSLRQKAGRCLLILDEAQLVPEWQSVVKGLWDEDKLSGQAQHVIITGSSALLLQKGSESLAGRFEKHELLQWSYGEMKSAFDYTLDEFIYFGGYPGAAPLRGDSSRWRNYIRASLIETVLGKDIIALSRITKPSLLQQLFTTICSYPSEIVAYNKLLGQLSDAGNVTTLSDYRELLESAFLLKTLSKWTGSKISTKASKPKWILRDNALATAMQSLSQTELKRTSFWGRLVENAVIKHLLELSPPGHYWREKHDEVDYILESSAKIYALEIKSGSRLRSRSGLMAFKRRYPQSIPLVLGPEGIPIEEVLLAEEWRW